MAMDPLATIESYKLKCAEEGSSRKRRQKQSELTERAQLAHRTGNYEAALDLFCHLLAMVETDPSTTAVSEMRATMTANIASAMHFLDHENVHFRDLAKDFYERALDEFGKVEVGWITWMYYGNLTTKRMEYIRSRLDALSRGERPDPSVYQDGTGKTRHWTREEMEGTDRSWSFFSPYSWLYGGYQPTGTHVVHVESHTRESHEPGAAA